MRYPLALILCALAALWFTRPGIYADDCLKHNTPRICAVFEAEQYLTSCHWLTVATMIGTKLIKRVGKIMATANNFDQSSTGVNLELSCFFDAGMAQSDFDENFERVERDTPKGFYGDVYFYTNFGNDVFLENDARNYKIDCDSKTMIKRMFDFVGGDLREFMRDCEINSKDDVNVLLGQFESYVGYESEYLDFLDQYFELDFVIYQTRGYSQGDAATILIDRKAWDENLSKVIDRLFWDAPIYARLTITDKDGEEDIYLDELLEDVREYDRDLILEQFKPCNAAHEHFGLMLEFLESELPDHPEHY